MLKVAVCDDEKAIASVIEKLLAEIGNKENIPMEIEVYYSGEELLRDYQLGERYDLLYLDIQIREEMASMRQKGSGCWMRMRFLFLFLATKSI